jgi:hypothetical protein
VWWIERNDLKDLDGKYSAPAVNLSVPLKTSEDPDAITLQVWVDLDRPKSVLLRTAASAEFFMPKSAVTLRPRDNDSYDATIAGWKVKEVGLEADGSTTESRAGQAQGQEQIPF